MKCSMSMSCLDSSPKLQKTPDASKKPNPNRLCNSLSSKKTRRAPDKKLLRRSWESTEEMSQEELWKSCLQSVQGASELDCKEREAVRLFLEDYFQISDWLNSVQAERSRFADALILSNLADDMYSKQHMQNDMNERGRILAKNLPKLKEEFQWRMKHMNSQWDSLEKILLCQSSMHTQNSHFQKNHHESDWDINWVSRWLREKENELQPLAFNVQWTSGHIEKELHRHQTLQSEIEAKSSLVHGALRQCRTQGQQQFSKKRVDVLERRWIQLRLRVLEWVEHLVRLQHKQATKEIGRVREGSFLNSNKEISEDEVNEPLSKYPRLGSLSSLAGGVLSDSEAELDVAQEQENGHLEIESPTLNGQGNWRMGQSHENGSVCQSGSPVPNSVIEFSFDGVSSGSVGLKRKISSSPPPRRHQINIGGNSPFASQVVSSPVNMQMNISTYYFKHSDTEAEGGQSHDQLNHTGDSEGKSPSQRNLTKKKTRAVPSSSNSDQNPPIRIKCQQILDFGQDDFITTAEGGRLSPSLNLGFESSDAVEEMDHETTTALREFDEIEELVQKAEFLVKGRGKGQRTVSGESFHKALDTWALPDDEDEENIEFLPSMKDSLAILKTYTKNYAAHIGDENEEPMTCWCEMNLEEVGAVGGFCVCRDRLTNGSVPLKDTRATTAKVTKKHSRVRQWVRSHKSPTTIITEQKSTSSCDASGESASESESDVSGGDGSNEEPQLSSDDPTILTSSTTLLLQNLQQPIESRGLATSSPKRGSSYGSLKSVDQTPGSGHIVFRPKKIGQAGGKQRPKSFTFDNFSSSQVTTTDTNLSGTGFERSRFGKALSPIHDFNQKPSSVFVSDSALNLLEKSNSESEGGSPEGSQSALDTLTLREKRKGKFRRRLSKHKRASLDLELEDELHHFTSTSTFAAVGFTEIEHHLGDVENTLSVLKPVFKLDHIDNASVNTEELQANDQDWDSYQEKYLSEPYSEELYDQDRTLKLLAFGEDYDKVLNRADSESSSLLSGFHQLNPRKRRPLTYVPRGEMAESDSDREEFNHFLIQSITQLRFIDGIFRKQLGSCTIQGSESPSEFAEMAATCEENINSLKLILSNVEKPDGLPFDIDIKSIQDVLDNWDLLRHRISQAAKLNLIQGDLKFLRKHFESIQRDLGLVDPFDSKDLLSLQSKIERIQSVLNELTVKKGKLQSVNEASVGTQIYLKDANVSVKKQLKNLYALYEENFQLGSYLLDKMRFLEEAWASFEQEKDAFEKSLVIPSGGRPKGKKYLSSGASTDSGHGTDFSHDSSISDSDIDEKRQKLVALRKRALDLKAFLPVGSPVLDVIDSKINEAQRDFEMMEKVETAPLNLKLIFPKRKSPIRKTGTRTSKSPPLRSSIPLNRPRSSSTPASTKKDPSRHWRTLRFSITFHLALMGLFAVAWFLQPRCCESMNTFSFSLLTHLTHDRIPHI